MARGQHSRGTHLIRGATITLALFGALGAATLTTSTQTAHAAALNDNVETLAQVSHANRGPRGIWLAENTANDQQVQGQSGEPLPLPKQAVTTTTAQPPAVTAPTVVAPAPPKPTATTAPTVAPTVAPKAVAPAPQKPIVAPSPPAPAASTGGEQQAGQGNTAPPAASAPAPAPAPTGVVQAAPVAGEPCRSGTYFAGTPSSWQTPPGCYGGIYAINPANYVARSGFGWCNWWVEVMNPSRPDLLWGRYARGTTPRAGATVVFAGGVQGASPAGHYARVVAVAPDGYWFLVSEMNFYWRGGGWQKVSYRYVHAGPGISFIY